MCPRRRLISLSPRYLLTWQCRRLSTVSTPHLWMLLCRRSHTVLFLRTFLRRWVLADVSSRTIFLIVRARHRHKAILVVSHCLHFLTLLQLKLSALSSLDSDDHVRTLAPRVLLQPPPGLEQYAPPPGLEIDAHLCASHGIPVKAAPLRPRLRSVISVTPPQPPVCTIHVGTHPARSATTGKRSASTALAGTHNPVDTDPRAGTGPFPKPRALVLPLVHFCQSNLKGTVLLIQPTVISCIINFVFPSFSGIQARRAEILLTLSPLPVVSFMQLFFKKPVITSRTSLSSSLCAPAIRTLLSCSIKTPLSLTLQFSHTRLTPRAKVRGVWYLLIVRGCSWQTSISRSGGQETSPICYFLLQNVHMSHVVWLRNVMHLLLELLQRLYGYMREHNVDFIGGDFNMSAFATPIPDGW